MAQKTHDSTGTKQSTSQISKQELLSEINRLAEIFGKTPSISDMNSVGNYSEKTYRRRFGSWNQAIIDAGLNPNVEQSKIPNDDLLTGLTEFANRLGHTPTQKEMTKAGPYSSSTYKERFGTWNKALQAADLELNEKGYSDQKLINELKRVAKVCGCIPTVEEFDDKSKISSVSYYDHFGSWKSAIESANIADEYGGLNRYHINSKNLLSEIKRLTSLLGRAPSLAEMNESGKYSGRTYRRRFGSWSESLEIAGVADKKQEISTIQISEEELISSLRSLAKKIGRSPSFEEMREHGKYGPATYSYRFGSWNQALEAAELQARRSSNTQIPKRDLVIELKRLAEELGRTPQRKEMDDMGKYSGMTYYNRFGSWEKSIEEADILEMDL